MSRPTGRYRLADQTGSVTPMVIIFAIALLLLAGLVFDGGRILTAHRRAINTAEQAARAGAQEISIASIRAGGPYRLDPPAARAAALAYLGRAGYGGGTAQVQGDTIAVQVHWSQPTIILRVVGIGAGAGTAGASARNVHGVTTEEP